MPQLPAIPYRSPVLAQVTAWLINRDWNQWFIALARAVNLTAQQTGLAASFPAQSGPVLPTTLVTAPVEGLYRLIYAARVTQAAGVSSSLTILLTWVDGGVTQQHSSAAVTGNTTTTRVQNTVIAHVDAGSLITLEAQYASVGPPAMAYRLDARVESLP